MKFRHIRNATSIIEYKDVKLLIDPALAPKNSYRNLPLRYRDVFQLLKQGNPFVDIKTDMNEVLEADVILSTHNHFDHFDKAAKALLNKDKKLFCQPCDVRPFLKAGFINIEEIDNSVEFKGIRITRVPADHGRFGGDASGYILSAKNEPTVYLAGDTIYTSSVKNIINSYKPDVIVLNGGGARLFNTPLIMDIADIEKTLKDSPTASYIIVHLDTINHCLLTRKIISDYFTKEKLKQLGVSNFYVPEDNSETTF